LPLESGPGPPFDPAHDSSGEGATQPEYLCVRERRVNGAKKERKKRKKKSAEDETEKKREKKACI